MPILNYILDNKVLGSEYKRVFAGFKKGLEKAREKNGRKIAV